MDRIIDILTRLFHSSFDPSRENRRDARAEHVPVFTTVFPIGTFSIFSFMSPTTIISTCFIVYIDEVNHPIIQFHHKRLQQKS